MRHARAQSAKVLEHRRGRAKQSIGRLELTPHRMQDRERVEHRCGRQRTGAHDHEELLAAANRFVHDGGTEGSG